MTNMQFWIVGILYFAFCGPLLYWCISGWFGDWKGKQK